METKTSSDRPLIIFFFLAFIMAWILMGLAIAENFGWFEITIPTAPILIIGSWIPNLAAVLVIAFVLNRRSGIKPYLKGWLKFKVPVFWYLVTLSPLILSFLSILIYKQIFGVAPVENSVLDPVAIVGMLILITITGALGEELGWRGFALPWLQSRMSALSASLVLGILWVIWHSPLWFAGMGFEEIPFGAYAIIGVSFTVLVTWACNNARGSLVIASLFHLTLNVSVNIIESQALYIHAVLFLVLSFIVVWVYGSSTLTMDAKIPIQKNTKRWI